METLWGTSISYADNDLWEIKQKNFTDIHGSIIPATATEHMELHGLWYVGALLSSTS